MLKLSYIIVFVLNGLVRNFWQELWDSDDIQWNKQNIFLQIV